MKKSLSLLLAILMLVSCLFVFASCTDEKAPVSNNDNKENQDKDNEKEEVVKTFGGRDFVIYARGSAFAAWESFDIYAEAENGDRINDAVYTRNANVEAKHDVKIKMLEAASSMQNDAYNQIASGTAGFDVIVTGGSINKYLAQSDMLLNLYEIDYLNLDEAWWDQNANNDFTIGEALYFTCSDLTISDLDGTWLVTFNKRIIEDNQLANPYQLVYDDEWTWDKYLEMAKQGSQDLSGDGLVNDPDRDQYGISAEIFDTVGMFYGAGCRITSRDEDNYPEITVYNDYSVQVVEKLFEMVNTSDMYTTQMGIMNFATESRALFQPTTVMTIRLNYNEMKDDFGVLPVPKFNEEQDRYYHMVSITSTGSTVAVPRTSSDHEFVGTVLESLTEESSKILIPEYYNEILENRYLRDDESRDMLEIVFSSRVFDLGYMYGWGDFKTYIFSGIAPGESNNFASAYDSMIDAAISEMEDTIDIYIDIE